MSKIKGNDYFMWEYLKTHSVEETARKFKVKYETVTRKDRRYREYLRMENKEGDFKIPKILLFDLETSPNVSYHWDFWKQNIGHQQIIHPWILISWAAKWLYEPEPFGDVLTRKEAQKHNDKRICESLLKTFNDADIIIAHNMKGFDEKKAKTRFLINELKPPSPYQSIDTLEQSRKNFALPSNRLDYIAKLFYDDSKLPTAFALWPRCLNWFREFSKEEQQEALDHMFEYNKKDVLLLEDYYITLRPWIKNHPNLGIYMEADVPVCTNCGSQDVYEDTKNPYVTGVNEYNSLRCNKCGAVAGRKRKSNIRGDYKDNLLSPTAR